MTLSAILKKIYAGSLRTAVRLNRPGLAAVLILPTLQTLKRAKAADTRTVVILPKAGFTEDAMTALTGAESVKVMAFPRSVVKCLAAPFLPYFIDDNNYISCGSEYDDAKQRYRRFLVNLFGMLRRFMRIDAVMTGNFAYAAERELARAMEEIGIPFIVLQKENLKTPGLIPYYERIYRDRRGLFAGRKILVYNSIERDLEIRAGVVKPEQVDIVGMPRLDRLHRWRRAHAGPQTGGRILFFAFSPVTGLPRTSRKGPKPGKSYAENSTPEESVSLTKLAAGTYTALLQIARDNPEISIVVKTKGRVGDRAEIISLFGVGSEADLPSNVTLVHGGDVLDLIADASVVCGFNSTALLEAVAAGKPVVMPWFEEAETPEVLPYLVDLRAISVASPSPETLGATLLKMARDPASVPRELDAEARQVLTLWTGNDDGCAAARAREAIVKEIGLSERLSITASR